LKIAKVKEFDIAEIKESMKNLVHAITKTWNSRGYDCFVLEDDGRDPAIGVRYRISTPLYRVTIEERKAKEDKDIFPSKKLSSEALEPALWGERLKVDMIAAFKHFHNIKRDIKNCVEDWDHKYQKIYDTDNQCALYKCRKCEEIPDKYNGVEAPKKEEKDE